MKITLAMLITLIPLLAAADIYKSVDSDGRVIYSDVQTPGSVKIQGDAVPVAAPPAGPQGAAVLNGTTDPNEPYKTLRIQRPAAGETLMEVSGALTIELEVAPPLKIPEGHTLSVMIDGNKFDNRNNATWFTISNVEAGAHTLQAQILDKDGNEQISSDRITFQMRREAKLPEADKVQGTGAASAPGSVAAKPQ